MFSKQIKARSPAGLVINFESKARYTNIFTKFSATHDHFLQRYMPKF